MTLLDSGKSDNGGAGIVSDSVTVGSVWAYRGKGSRKRVRVVTAGPVKVEVAIADTGVRRSMLRESLKNNYKREDGAPVIDPDDEAAAAAADRKKHCGVSRSWVCEAMGKCSDRTNPHPSTHEGKRAAVLAAASAAPQASNREIARAAGVDHKTVAKVREAEPVEPPNIDEDGLDALPSEPPPAPPGFSSAARRDLVMSMRSWSRGDLIAAGSLIDGWLEVAP